MDSTRAPQHERRARTRTALLRAAGRVFTERSYHAATLEEVFVAAEVSRGALYHYFGSKQELFVTLLEDRLTAGLTVATDRAATPDVDHDQAGSAAVTFLRRVGRDPSWLPLLLEFLALGMRDSEVRASVRAHFIEPAREGTAALIRRLDLAGLRDGPVTVDELAVATNALINGMAIERAFDPDGVPDSLVGRVLALITAGLEASATPTTPSDTGP